MKRPEDSIPEPVRRFVLSRVGSVPFLEAARIFHSHPTSTQTITKVAGDLYVRKDVAAKLLEELVGAGVITKLSHSRGYIFNATDTELVSALDQLFACYATNLVGVTNLIHNRTLRSAERFSDAFKWRKDS